MSLIWVPVEHIFVTSGILIGSSFVFKKKGLINCTKNGMLAGEGHAYLKSVMWWTGMLMMVAGEVCNFVAYAFVQPILVTPLGALSVVICAVLSSIFLRERLNLQGKVGCAQCIIGATIIVLHAPEQTSVRTIQEFQHYMIQPIFLSWMIIVIIGSLLLIFKAGPKWGKQHMMVYIGVCSLIGSLSVVATQGLGAAIVHNISTGENQFNNWFIYFVIVFMVITLLTEINYLNKALNLFNTAMVTPTYYVTFTSTTIVTSAILYQGFEASVIEILTICFGFLVICGGVLLLQTSKPVVSLHMPGTSSAGAIGTITYEELEPTAADMRASPFSSIRRISRDFRQPSVITNGANSVFQSSPLNPRAESLLQRKRRASNAAQWSRPQSMVSHHLGVPGTGVGIGVTGGATAFYPSTAGPHSTVLMGPAGAQIRLQLCEIVVSDEKNETSRYQVYRPLPANEVAETVATTTGYRQPFIAPRGSMLIDSRSSSIRFDNAPTALPTDNYNEKAPAQKYPAPISGSMFLPPKFAVSPPTPSPSSISSSNPVAPTVSAPISANPPSSPIVVGGSFFARPRFRSPSTSTAASGDIMEMNDPGHAGRTVVAIEPVQQQPLYSLYVPPTPTQQHLLPKPIPAPPTSSTTHGHSPLALPTSPTSLTNSTNSSASSTANVANSDRSHKKETSQFSSDANDDDDDRERDADVNNDHQRHNHVADIGDDHDDADATDDQATASEGTRPSPPGKPPRRGLFGLGRLFGAKEHKDRAVGGNASKNLRTFSSESNSSTTPLTPSAPEPLMESTPAIRKPPLLPAGGPVVFTRANHPTRISEGEEEEDTEDTKKGGESI
ncbi:hypothetical protein BGZ99_005586 [Dissophora globulifera]|uniref:DUF803-domain-containing protein n=1 Tax=Dissophora globulifera TaxID=979702 RepID=A0A9P6UTK5_9FUNG|nr:hypothetical protein BGZ99_005586 [Dissophora globulifera]